MPEVGLEVTEAKIGEPQSAPFLHMIAVSDTETWSVLAVRRLASVRFNKAAWRHLATSYQEVAPPPNFRDMFGITRRFIGTGFEFMESKWTMPPNMHASVIAQRAHASLMPFLSESTTGAFDGVISPSIYKSREMPFPASLARYALTFYLSSIVRYHPGKLDPGSQAAQSWFFDRFVNEVDIPVLIDATNSIRGSYAIYFGKDSFRH